jgi:hypothetical protein
LDLALISIVDTVSPNAARRVSSAGNGFAVQQSRFQVSKWFCCTAKSFPAQEMVFAI